MKHNPKNDYIETLATQPQKYLHRSPCNTTPKIFTQKPMKQNPKK
jgi:hypothetical protein